MTAPTDCQWPAQHGSSKPRPNRVKIALQILDSKPASHITQICHPCVDTSSTETRTSCCPSDSRMSEAHSAASHWQHKCAYVFVHTPDTVWGFLHLWSSCKCCTLSRDSAKLWKLLWTRDTVAGCTRCLVTACISFGFANHSRSSLTNLSLKSWTQLTHWRRRGAQTRQRVVVTSHVRVWEFFHAGADPDMSYLWCVL